ncbi:MAG: penicillin-binding protein 1C [Gemmatimonadales bacterium]|nr:penicillin-binding protein 1C [Gemmatimonadales bacterium]
MRGGRLLLGAGAMACAVAVLGAAWIARPLPPPVVPGAVPGLVLVDRHGLPLRTARRDDGARQLWRPLAELDPDLVTAFVVTEDRRFRAHGGVDGRAAARALRDAVRLGRVTSGASTITMQLARLERGLGRGPLDKARQLLWAWRYERQLGKEAILERYLNRVPLGHGTVGVEAAARLYFGATSTALSAGQAALLAGLASNPERDDPLRHADAAARRRATVLARLRAHGALSAGDAALAALEPLPGGAPPTPFDAPHFTSWLLAGRRDTATTAEWRTTLDLPLQAMLEDELRQAVRALGDRQVGDAALVVLDNARGEVLAWIGSPDFTDPADGQTDMVTSPRQPGSALKPFVYALAFERGHDGSMLLHDEPRAFATAAGPYRPRNYDRRFRGPVRAREALASSLNVPTVELADRLGVGGVLHLLHEAGFASLSRSAEHYGLGLALGNGDVTLLELANAYRMLANGGTWTPVQARLDRTAAAAERESRRVLSPFAAALALDILADADARTAGFGAVTPFEFPFPAAVKTGTSRHFTDNWAVGVTGGFTVAVWVGNFDGRPMAAVSGITGAGPLLRRAMLLTAARHAPGRLVRPDEAGGRRVRVCRADGRPDDGRCRTVPEWRGPEVPGPATERAGDAAAAVRLLSPRDGDRYAVPPGVPARYATIALRAEAGAAPLSWEVDGRAHPGGRLRLAPGSHTVVARAGGAATAARIVVE